MKTYQFGPFTVERSSRGFRCDCPQSVFGSIRQGPCRHITAAMNREREHGLPEFYELAPKRGMSYRERKSVLDGARFVAVRNLAHVIYKREDGTSLMTFMQTLEDRETVKQVILQHELKLGLIQPDYPAPETPKPLKDEVISTVKQVLEDALQPEKLRPLLLDAADKILADRLYAKSLKRKKK